MLAELSGVARPNSVNSQHFQWLNDGSDGAIAH